MTRLRSLLNQQGSGPLLGASAYFNDPVFIEMCTYLGFKVMWIEMEHSHITFAEAVNLCRISQGCGLLTMIRIPNASRENVLKAAECGPDIINIPMANSAQELLELIKYARFAPIGERGYFSVSPHRIHGR
jgi:2-keto-3-deoxy-L-rhamnonate aldolase RhmA